MFVDHHHTDVILDTFVSLIVSYWWTSIHTTHEHGSCWCLVFMGIVDRCPQTW